MKVSPSCWKFATKSFRPKNGGGFNSRPFNGNGGFNNGKGGYKGGFNNKFGRNNRHNDRGMDQEDKDLVDRTLGRSSTRFGDGLMGQPDYAIDEEAVNNIKWTDSVSKDEDAAKPEQQGVSNLATQESANRRILSLPLVNSLVHNRKYEWLTPVQAQTLLPILRNESVVVRAKTGTGKTAAFSIPSLQKVIESKKKNPESGKVSASIVSPTRELAQQIADEVFKITQFGGSNHIKVQSLVGGVSKPYQLQAAGLTSGQRGRTNRVADIIVATPGRLRDVLDDPEVAERFSDLHARVFDEADRILDIGFEREMHEIKDIIDEVSDSKEIPLLSFSATADRTMREFARKQFGDRVRVVDTVPKNEPTANESVEQHATSAANWADVYEAATKEILTSYEHAKENNENFKAVVFLPTTAMVDHYEQMSRRMLTNKRGRGTESPVLGIHGQRKQQSRQNRSDQFRKAKDAILITTDVVARGMDFPQVTHVFQLGPPPDVPSYVHRIGRTARIGNSGKSFLYFPQHVRGYIDGLAREHIKPELSVYTSDPEFREKMAEPFAAGVEDDEEAQTSVQSLMSYMTVSKSKYPMNPSEFLRDMDPYVQSSGLEGLKLSATQRQAWSGRNGSGGNRYGGRNNYGGNKQSYGSSRRGRMRW